MLPLHSCGIHNLFVVDLYDFSLGFSSICGLMYVSIFPCSTFLVIFSVYSCFASTFFSEHQLSVLLQLSLTCVILQ